MVINEKLKPVALSICSAFLCERESVELDVYLDQADLWTYGVGHLITHPQTGAKLTSRNCTKLEARRIIANKIMRLLGNTFNPFTKTGVLALLEHDLSIFSTRLDADLSGIRKPLNPNQYAAILSFAFNIGSTAFSHSSCCAHLIDRLDTSALRSLQQWNKVTINGNKRISQGLVNRRRAECDLFNKPYTV